MNAPLQVIDQLRNRAAAAPRRIVFPESHDARVIEAVNQLAERQICIPMLVTEQTDLDLHNDVRCVSPSDLELVSACGKQLFENRKHRGLSQTAALQAIADPILMASLMVRIGKADASVAGSIATTASVILAGLYGVGTAPGRKLVSSFFLMQLADRAITYADCGVVPDPNSQQLAEIAISAAENHALLTGETPHVALLSFSTFGSASHPRIEKVRAALTIARELAPNLSIDGELQFDAAFDELVGKRKAPESPVAGNANVFVFPDLDSGNIAYKITERLAGATALGPIVQGLAKPCMDLSRGCSAQDIVDVAAIASVLAGETINA